MRKLLAYPLTVVHIVLFFTTLLMFHALQWIALNLLGAQAHKKTVDYLNFTLLGTMLPLGNRFRMQFEAPLKTGRSYIFVCNHQSLFDIPPLSWFLREYYPKFIAKKELGKNIPSISYNLQKGGNALIDRRNARKSIQALIGFAREKAEKNHSVVIFAEGSRSRDGLPRPFRKRGLQTLFKFMPEAQIVPVVINHSWKITPYGSFPYGIGNRINIRALKPMPVPQENQEECIDHLQEIIHKRVQAG